MSALEPFIGEVYMFGGNFAPRGWAFCHGQLLPISVYTALFSLIGTTYGGDGQTTFALPDLRGRVPVHQGQGPGLIPRVIGETFGTEQVSLTSNQLPVHNHNLNASKAASHHTGPVGHVTADTSAAGAKVYASGPPDDPFAPTTVQPSGGNQPHDNMMPFVAVNFIIALEGIFPSRN